jgi:hypothetical protein
MFLMREVETGQDLLLVVPLILLFLLFILLVSVIVGMIVGVKAHSQMRVIEVFQ